MLTTFLPSSLPTKPVPEVEALTSKAGVPPQGLPASAALPGFSPAWTLRRALPFGLAEGFSRPLALSKASLEYEGLVGDDRGLLPKGLPALATCKRLFPKEKEPGVGSFAIHGASLRLNLWGIAVTAIQRSPCTLVAHVQPIWGVTRRDLSLRPLQLSLAWTGWSTKKSSLLRKGLSTLLTDTHILLPTRKKRRKGLVVLEGSSTLVTFTELF